MSSSDDGHHLVTVTPGVGELAGRFATDHHSIDDALMREIKAQFTEVEIIELTALCAMTVGNGRFMTVLGIEADDDGFYLLPEGD
jgi:hypothetical protein